MKIYIGSNWKMHKNIAEATEYSAKLRAVIESFHTEDFIHFAIPPITSFKSVQEVFADCPILLGAQNMHWEAEGNFTGEISPAMLSEYGIDIIEIGHSERRQLYNETDFSVNKKVLSGLSYGFTTLICVGEPIEEKNYGVSEEYIKRQVKIALNGVSEASWDKIWIAYEPVWSIGPQGTEADPHYVSEINNSIRSTLMELFPEKGASIPILYGGSVNPRNCEGLICADNTAGLFIGRAAWNADSYFEIMQRIWNK